MNGITTLVWDGPAAVTESSYGIAIGYYTDCDTALCRDCIPDADAWAHGNYTGWDGFEGWESPSVIFTDTESDSVTSCATCGAVIRHDLTTDGARYVMDAIAEFIAGEGHDPDVMAQWWGAYGEDEYALDHTDLCEIIRRAMVARGTREYVPDTQSDAEQGTGESGDGHYCGDCAPDSPLTPGRIAAGVADIERVSALARAGVQPDPAAGFPCECKRANIAWPAPGQPRTCPSCGL